MRCRQTGLVLSFLIVAIVSGIGPGRADECETIGTVPDTLVRLPSRVAFCPGEYLEFSVQYGLITAGTATMSVDTRILQRQGRPTYHFITTARSNKMFSTFFKVNDRVESFMDTLQLHSVRFEKHLREGKYNKDLWVTFDQERGTASINGERECEVLEHVQDVLSSFYYVRTLDLRVGESYFVPNHDNGKNYAMEVTVHRRERVEVDAGTFDCLVLEPIILGEALFKQKGRLHVWVTDDEVKMPVLMKSKVLVGAIAAVLTDFKLGDACAAPTAMVNARE
ncbi:MAG: DUF3108 domain-containing protein [Candidatus Latescibacterota bacterium]|nr:MAG: DUF3108 domain-containing protein [Candidatus Latescibacterota bacterium]